MNIAAVNDLCNLFRLQLSHEPFTLPILASCATAVKALDTYVTRATPALSLFGTPLCE